MPLEDFCGAWRYQQQQDDRPAPVAGHSPRSSLEHPAKGLERPMYEGTRTRVLCAVDGASLFVRSCTLINR